MSTNYQEALIPLREQLTSILPAAALEIFNNDAKNMQAGFKQPLKLNKGDKAPDFTLPNALSGSFNLYDTLKKQVAVLVFYRGEWCPYCNLQLSLLQKDLELFKAKNAQLVAISPQNPNSTLSLVEKQQLQFEVLSDARNQVAKQYTHVFRSDKLPLQAMASLGYDFDSFYTDDSKELPVPAVFVIAPDGTILFAESAGGDYRNRVEAATILATIK